MTGHPLKTATAASSATSTLTSSYGRPAGGWDWRGPAGDRFTPIDLEAGGTWIGINRLGVVAALTNIFPSWEGSDYRSRGALVTDMLRLERATGARATMADSFEKHSYNKFNLLVADPLNAFVFTWVGKDLETFGLRPGVYEVNNIAFDGIEKPNPGVTNERWLEREEGRLSQHPMICRHGDGYGTRCSHKILVHEDGLEKSRVWHLEGHPCEGQFQQVLGGPGG